MDSGSQNSNNVSRHFREKHTTPDDVLPSPAEIIPDDYNAVLNYVNLDGEPQKLEYRNLAKLDPMPVPMPVDREHYGTLENSAHYWATGHGDWLNVCEAIERYMNLTGKTQPLRLMDFGCATGRFLRHSYVFGKEKIDNWGCDFAPTNVAWSKQHLTPEIKIILNSSTPHLPFADGFFDVVTAFSVFTHINLLEDAWLLELRRITKPNGLLYLTIQNEAAWAKIIDSPWVKDHMFRANDVPGNLELTEELFLQPLPRQRIAFRMSKADVYSQNVWMSNDYIRQNWSRYFEILDIANNAHTCFQSPVIMRPLSDVSANRISDVPEKQTVGDSLLRR